MELSRERTEDLKVALEEYDEARAGYLALTGNESDAEWSEAATRYICASQKLGALVRDTEFMLVDDTVTVDPCPPEEEGAEP